MTRKTDLYGWYRERGGTTQNCDYSPRGTGRGSAHCCNSLGRTATLTLLPHSGRSLFVKPLCADVSVTGPPRLELVFTFRIHRDLPGETLVTQCRSTISVLKSHPSPRAVAREDGRHRSAVTVCGSRCSAGIPLPALAIRIDLLRLSAGAPLDVKLCQTYPPQLPRTAPYAEWFRSRTTWGADLSAIALPALPGHLSA